VLNAKSHTRWLRLVGCLKLYGSLENIGFFYRALLQKRPTILRGLLIVVTPYDLSRCLFERLNSLYKTTVKITKCDFFVGGKCEKSYDLSTCPSERLSFLYKMTVKMIKRDIWQVVMWRVKQFLYLLRERLNFLWGGCD